MSFDLQLSFILLEALDQKTYAIFSEGTAGGLRGSFMGVLRGVGGVVPQPLYRF